MLLGKRRRHPIKRTTSMAGITVDVVQDNIAQQVEPISHEYYDPQNNPNPNFSYEQRLLAMVSPRNPAGGGAAAGCSGFGFTNKSSNHVVDTTAPFLRSCCLCKSSLAPGRDIYMYRGDTAFCSLECREQQMKQDERREKSNVLASKKEVGHAHAY